MSLATSWDRIGKRAHHGINVPLFSLRTQQSCGIGEYLDLIPIIKWCKRIGFDVIQTLPLNDTAHDYSPYNALSAFALNPMHLSLAQLPEVEGDKALEEEISQLQKLNALPRVDYTAVQQGKEKFLKAYLAEHGAELAASPGFRRFVENNPWLESYAHYKGLKEANDWKSWEKWTIQDKPDLLPHQLLQYLCFLQLEKVQKEAASEGILLKGDIPILINRDSADVWHEPQYFDLTFSAGAPPDMYSLDGQKWGFPLYRWEELEKNDLAWWKQRLGVAARLYNLYRLDHIVGFFRIWAIPQQAEAKEGAYIPADLNVGLQQGRNILSHLTHSSTMVPIGEDLGNVPNEVRECLAELEICGTKVMRWERRWQTDRSFINPADYPVLSMTTVSTHDSETLREWWTKHPDEAADYAASKGWTYASELTTEQQKEILRDSHQSGSLFHINLLQEYLTLFPDLRWSTAEEERINIPGVLNDTNWTYKFKPSVEELTQHEALAQLMRELILPNG